MKKKKGRGEEDKEEEEEKWKKRGEEKLETIERRRMRRKLRIDEGEKKIGPGKEEGEGKTAAEESLSCLDELSPGFLVSSICPLCFGETQSSSLFSVY